MTVRIIDLNTRPAGARFGAVLRWVLVGALCVATLGAQALPTTLPREAVMDIVVEEALREGVPVDLALAVAATESSFATLAVSSAGARGVMQLMPRTGRDLYGLEPYELFDARTNARYGLRFLASLIEQYGRVDIALSHYNGGSRVRRSDGSLAVIPATRGYVDRVLGRRAQYVAYVDGSAAESRPVQIAARSERAGQGATLRADAHTVNRNRPANTQLAAFAPLNAERAQIAAALAELIATNEARSVRMPGEVVARVPNPAETLLADASRAERLRKVRQWESFR